MPLSACPPPAIALYALQQFAPSGGAGNRTSMRGGGPLSTFVLPGAAGGRRPSLWRAILANLAQARQVRVRGARICRKILPWLAPTLVSDKAHGERLVSEGDPDTHPLQAFFGMPRRIALRFAGAGRCDDDRRDRPARRWLRPEAVGRQLRGMDASADALPRSRKRARNPIA